MEDARKFKAQKREREREVEFISKKAEKKEKKRYSLEQMD